MGVERAAGEDRSATGGVLIATPVAARSPHPNIRRAINALETAKVDLQNADRDFGGRRAEALEGVNRALGQLRIALHSDRD